MYHQTMTGCKRSHSSKIIIETAIFQLCEPHCDLDLSDSKSICLCATLGHNAACATLGHNAACATLGHNAACATLGHNAACASLGHNAALQYHV